MNGTVVSICISPIAGEPMQEVPEVEAIAGAGLKGDRYCTGQGSFNRNKPGNRQVTLINAAFLEGSGYNHRATRRNIATAGVELMWLINREFQIGQARFLGIKYCDPCTRPNELAGNELEHVKPFNVVFHDRGGLIAEVLEGGVIKIGDAIIPPPKGY